MRTLSHQAARRVYDRIGAWQDTQGFYEDRATDLLAGHSDFAGARAVFELGCGTGRFAERLLAKEMPPTGRYRGVDLSPVMIDLARARVARFGSRAEIELSEGAAPTGEAAEACDRFVSNYVFDLLSEEDIAAVLGEAHRMLRPGGLLCLCSLSTGCGTLSRQVARLWAAVHALSPALVGGCRPLDLVPLLPSSTWRVSYRGCVAPLALPSEVVVAERL